MNTQANPSNYLQTLETQNESYSTRLYRCLQALEQIASCDAGAICCKSIAEKAIQQNKHA